MTRRALSTTASVIALLVFAGAIIWAVSSALDTKHGGEDEFDWRLDDRSCVPSGGLIEYSGTITNEDTRPHGYHMTAVFESDGVREDSDEATVRDVQPDETVRWRFLARSRGEVSCRVSDVEVLN